MKKSKLTGLLLISFLLFLVSVNFSVAATPSYVGINEGDEFEWALTWDKDVLKQFLTDIGQPPETGSDQFLQNEKLNIKVKIIDISDEKYTDDLYYVEVKVQPYIGSVQLEQTFVVWILKNETTDYMARMAALLSGAGEGVIAGLFVPIGLDWEAIAKEFNDYIEPRSGDVDISVTAYSNGLKLVIPAFTYEDKSLKAVEGEIRYNQNGVLEYAQAKYDGNVMMTVQMGGIPGYELAIIICASAGTSIGLIYLIWKKKEII